MTPFMFISLDVMMENNLNEKSRSKKKCLLFVLFNVYLNFVSLSEFYFISIRLKFIILKIKLGLGRTLAQSFRLVDTLEKCFKDDEKNVKLARKYGAVKLISIRSFKKIL
ncbi:hypothetical protein BpHYR1_037237 [Brachionus plicatilis]|uniref:Uncharacterized protein n=1 Tax=Brachionus plicatilis TaxID=10195 RepID=A0A3M7T5M4_BRAPC|nr:hypothetical protein BpHYR1_037237 [Brachionus plicatilis]